MSPELRRIEHVDPGSVILFFAGLARVMAVERCPAFPTARSLRMRPATGGADVVALVPADFCPLVVPR